MCKKILAHGIKTLHLYTLNMEKSALGILLVTINISVMLCLFRKSCIFEFVGEVSDRSRTLQNLGLIEESKISRSLPWRRPTNVFRAKEDVRPIFWYFVFSGN